MLWALQHPQVRSRRQPEQQEGPGLFRTFLPQLLCPRHACGSSGMDVAYSPEEQTPQRWDMRA